MKTIWNQKVDFARLSDVLVVDFPAGAKLLSVINQHDNLVVYALVDPTKPKQNYRLAVIGTGHKVADQEVAVGKQTFLGTVQFANGSLVFHVFDIT